jgi:hypothetical protein
MTKKKTLLLLSPLAFLLLVGCPAAVIDLGCDWGCLGGTGTGAGGSGGADAGTGGSSLCLPGATASCYDGPAGTEGVGLCQAGTRTCAADGASWGPCAGEVLPQPEDCATPVDEDCDGMAPSCKGALLWAKRVADQLSSQASAIAADGQGNVIVAGGFVGVADFGGGSLQSAGGADVFAAKFAVDGTLLWVRSFGDPADQMADSVAVDGDGNIVLTGSFAGAIDFGGGFLHSAGGQDVFVVKLDANGAHLWSKSFGDGSDQLGAGIAVDGAGDLIVTGSFFGTADFGGGALVSAGDSDVFLVKLDANGGHLWSKSFGGPADQLPMSIAVDDSKSIVLTGEFSGALDFGGGALVSTGFGDAFVAKLDANGGHLWSKSFGDGPADTIVGRGVVTDISGSVLILGEFDGAADFGDGPVSGTGMFLVKLDADGGHLWSKHLGAGSAQEARGVATDGAGNVLLTGTLHGAMDFGDGPIQSAGSGDLFVAKLDASGGSLWSKRFGNSKYQGGRGIATDTAGNAFVIGVFGGSVDFGGGTVLDGTSGSFNGCVAAFGP